MAIDYEHELNNGWSRWQNLVLQGLKTNEESQKAIQEDMQSVKIDLALVKAQTTALATTQLSQGGEIKVLQDNRSYMSGIWKAATLLSVSLVAVIGVLTGLLQAGILS